MAWAVNYSGAFTFTKGEPQIFQSSVGVERSFCGVCGTSLTYRRDTRNPIDVALATLDDPELLSSTKETWCVERMSWNPLNDSLQHYERGSSQH